MAWSLAEAKNQFSEVVRRAVDQGPQTICVRGEETAVLISKADYEHLRDPDQPKDFKEFLRSFPSLEDLDLTRDQSPARDIEL
jgi:prevent-host-death family protein